MDIDLTNPRPVPIGRGVAFVIGGMLAGLIAAALATAVSLPLVLLSLLAIAILLPTLLVRDFMLYWLSGYLLFLPFEASQKITILGADPEVFVRTFGLPPSTYLGIPIFPTDLVLAPLILAAVVAIQRGHASFQFPRVAILLVGFAVWATLTSLVKAQHLSLALVQVVVLFKFVVVFLFFTSVLGTHERQRFVTGVLLLALAMEVMIALGLFAAGYTRDSLAERLSLGIEHQYDFLREQEQALRQSADALDLRASGTFGAASHLAMYLQLLFPLPLAIGVVSRRPVLRLVCLGLYLLAAVSLYLTLSRAGLLGLVAGTFTCIVLLRCFGHLGHRAFLPAAYLVVVVVLTQIPIFYNHIVSRPYTFTHRFTLFREGIQLIVANPVLGVGANSSTAARVQSAVRLPDDSRSPSAISAFDNLYPIHNQYIVVASETGLVGFALGAAFFIIVGAQAVRVARSRSAFRSALGIATISGYAALGTQLMGDHFVGNAQHTILALQSAMVVALARLETTSTPPQHV